MRQAGIVKALTIMAPCIHCAQLHPLIRFPRPPAGGARGVGAGEEIAAQVAIRDLP